MPYIRVQRVQGQEVFFNESGEDSRHNCPRSHPISTDALQGCECLVITETLNNRYLKSRRGGQREAVVLMFIQYRENAFSGRVTKITANGANSLCLDDVGTISQFDYLLPAPPNYIHYRYPHILIP